MAHEQLSRGPQEGITAPPTVNDTRRWLNGVAQTIARAELSRTTGRPTTGELVTATGRVRTQLVGTMAMLVPDLPTDFDEATAAFHTALQDPTRLATMVTRINTTERFGGTPQRARAAEARALLTAVHHEHIPLTTVTADHPDFFSPVTAPADSPRPRPARPVDAAAPPVSAARPVDTAAPVDAAPPVGAARPVDAAAPVDAAPPVGAARPVDAAAPVDAAPPADAAPAVEPPRRRTRTEVPPGITRPALFTLAHKLIALNEAPGDPLAFSEEVAKLTTAMRETQTRVVTAITEKVHEDGGDDSAALAYLQQIFGDITSLPEAGAQIVVSMINEPERVIANIVVHGVQTETAIQDLISIASHVDPEIEIPEEEMGFDYEGLNPELRKYSPKQILAMRYSLLKVIDLSDNTTAETAAVQEVQAALAEDAVFLAVQLGADIETVQEESAEHDEPLDATDIVNIRTAIQIAENAPNDTTEAAIELINADPDLPTLDEVPDLTLLSGFIEHHPAAKEAELIVSQEAMDATGYAGFAYDSRQFELDTRKGGKIQHLEVEGPVQVMKGRETVVENGVVRLTRDTEDGLILVYHPSTGGGVTTNFPNSSMFYRPKIAFIPIVEIPDPSKPREYVLTALVSAYDGSVTRGTRAREEWDRLNEEKRKALEALREHGGNVEVTTGKDAVEGPVQTRQVLVPAREMLSTKPVRQEPEAVTVVIDAEGPTGLTPVASEGVVVAAPELEGETVTFLDKRTGALVTVPVDYLEQAVAGELESRREGQVAARDDRELEQPAAPGTRLARIQRWMGLDPEAPRGHRFRTLFGENPDATLYEVYRRFMGAPVQTDIPYRTTLWGDIRRQIEADAEASARRRAERKGRIKGPDKGWAGPDDIAYLVVDRNPAALSNRGRIIIAPGIAAPEGHSVFIIGMTESGKGWYLANNMIVDHQGPETVSTVKLDLVLDTIDARAAQGPVAIFAPWGVGEPNDPVYRKLHKYLVRISPTHFMSTYDKAKEIAHQMTDAATTVSGGEAHDFWNPLARGLIQVKGFMANKLGLGFEYVIDGLAELQEGIIYFDGSEDKADRARGKEKILKVFDDLIAQAKGLGEMDGTAREAEKIAADIRDIERARAEFEAHLGRSHKQAGSVVSVAQTLIDSYNSTAVMDSTAATDIDIAKFLQENGTLYFLGSAREQSMLAPMINTITDILIKEAISTYYSTGKKPDRALRNVRDEMGHTALPKMLATDVTTTRAMGAQEIMLVQSPKQIEDRIGPGATDTLMTNSTVVLLPGINEDTVAWAKARTGTYKTTEGHNVRTHPKKAMQIINFFKHPFRMSSWLGATTVTEVDGQNLPRMEDEDFALETGEAIILTRKRKPYFLVLQPYDQNEYATKLTRAHLEQESTEEARGGITEGPSEVERPRKRIVIEQIVKDEAGGGPEDPEINAGASDQRKAIEAKQVESMEEADTSFTAAAQAATEYQNEQRASRDTRDRGSRDER